MKTGARSRKVDLRSSSSWRKWWAGRVLESDAGRWIEVMGRRSVLIVATFC